MLISTRYYFEPFNLFLTNAPRTDKTDSWFLLAKYLKNACGRVTFSVKMQIMKIY